MLQRCETGAGLSSGAVRRVATGCVVKLQEVTDSSEWEVTIVLPEQADPEADQISDECPIGVALLGRCPGEVVTVHVPIGTVHYRVVSVD